ncbi:MAG: dTDP-4-dehydrorhamnose reductase [Desulfobacterales bacterium]|nr:dTDP-4-dehydrorhamnose reductase [Desulfobacterales bacterium]
MNLLIIGNGQLGQEISAICLKSGINYKILNIPLFDITNEKDIENFKIKDFSTVINASAYTDVEKAEEESDLADSVNAKGPHFISRKCAKDNVPLIHVSTDYVFDGNSQKKYTENDVVNPINQYGSSKEKGESHIRNNLKKHIIIRTSWLYSTYGNNFVKSMITLGRDRETLSIVNDQYGSPTYAFDLATVIVEICDKINKNDNIIWGTYHYSNKGKASWYDFAAKTFDLVKDHEKLKLKKLNGIPTSEYPTVAKRPFNSELDCSLIKKNFGIDIKLWKESLKIMITKLMEKK